MLVWKCSNKISRWGTWLAQPVEHGTLDLGVVTSSPPVGAELTLKKFQKKKLLQKKKKKERKNDCSLSMGTQRGAATLEDGLVVSYEGKHTLPI